MAQRPIPKRNKPRLPKATAARTTDQVQITGNPSRFAADPEGLVMLGKIKRSVGSPAFDEHGNPHPDGQDIDFPEE